MSLDSITGSTKIKVADIILLTVKPQLESTSLVVGMVAHVDTIKYLLDLIKAVFVFLHQRFSSIHFRFEPFTRKPLCE